MDEFFSQHLLYLVWLQLCSVEVLFPENTSCRVYNYFILTFQGKKNIFQLKQVNILLATMRNLNNLSRTFFPPFLSKSNKGNDTLNCSSLTEFRFNINKKLTQIEKEGKRLFVNLQIYQQRLNSWRMFGMQLAKNDTGS